jgi:tryptophan synthase beta chain
VASTRTKITLDESEMPTQLHNLVAELPTPPPPVPARPRLT